MDDLALAKPARFVPRRSARHNPAVASSRVSGLLALEISRSVREAPVSRELRELIRRMSKENPLWGAPRIHDELLKLGFEIAEWTVSKYMIRHRGPPSQTWRTFLRNHADAIAAIDLCVVPTLTFECLFALLVVGHGRRQLLWFAVSRHPTAEWLAQQIVEAFPWDAVPPTYLVCVRDTEPRQPYAAWSSSEVDCRNACASSRHFIARSSSTSRRLGSTVLAAARIQSSAWSS
jgi:hypothetical protein